MITDPVSDEFGLGQTARRGARSALIAQVSVQVGSAVATVILARLLMPAQFGIVALAQSLMGAASLVGLSGITAALITTRTDVRRKAATYFWVALVVGLTFAAILALLAMPVVQSLGQPDTAPYVIVLSFSLPLSLMTLVPQALLQRRLQFNRMNTVTVVGAFSYFILEVLLALNGWGPWAVIWGQVFGAGVSLLMALVLTRWLPLGLPRFSDIRDDVTLVGNMSASSFLTYVGKNADYWAVSATLGGPALGVYYIAYVLPNIVRVRLSVIFRQVMLPLVSGISDEEQQAEAWGKALRSTLTLALPTLAGLAAVSSPLVRVLFGDQWITASTPMRLITVAGIADIIITAVGSFAVARRSHVTRATMIVGLRAVLVAAGSVVASLTWGSISAVAWAVVVASLASLVVQELVVSRPLGIGIRRLGAMPLRAAAASVVMFAGVSILVDCPTFQRGSDITTLIIAVLAGIALYAGAAFVIAREALHDAWRQAFRIMRGS